MMTCMNDVNDKYDFVHMQMTKINATCPLIFSRHNALTLRVLAVYYSIDEGAIRWSFRQCLVWFKIDMMINNVILKPREILMVLII